MPFVGSEAMSVTRTRGRGRGSLSQRFDVFMSYNSRDRATVQRIAERLKASGLEPWLDRWSLTPGGEWQRELGAGLDASATCAVFVGPHDLGGWESEEVAVAIDRAATQQGFRVFPVLLPGVEDPFDPNGLPHFLRARTWVDFRRGRDDDRALQDLINAIRSVPFGPDMPVARRDQIAPYRGLRVFGEEDAPFFFGRDGEIQRLLEKLKRSRFIAVLGPSGSGKSSLVQAGLVPELRAGAQFGHEDELSHVLVLRPGAAPLTALAAQLATLLPGQAMQPTLDALAWDARTLHLSVELALAYRPAGARIVVIVDQLEEVFTLCRDETQRRQLLSLLLDAATAPGGRTIVIVTLRTDFYARCASYPELAQLISDRQMLVGAMDSDELRQAIEEPAHRVGLELEEGLPDTILADVAGEPGALPLLEHALLELWERRRGTMLTLEGYRQAGGVDGALAQRADQIFDEFSHDQRQIARRTLLRLTQPGEGTEDTRRRALRSELSPAEDDESFDMVLDRLVDARLLTTGRDETGQQVIDVSHEALIRGWPRLRGWIDADRGGLLIHRRLTDAAHQWDTLDREAASLYRGARLDAAREWATDHDDDLSSLEHDFLTASQTNEHSETEAAKRTTRRLRGLAIGLAVLIVIVAGLAVWAIGQRDAAATAFRSQQALSIANELEKSLLAIETELGRYVTSGDMTFLTPVRRTLAEYPKRRDALAQRVSDDPGQQQLVREISAAIDDYANVWVGNVISIARHDLGAAATQIRTNGGGARLDVILRNFERLSLRERAVIIKRERRVLYSTPTRTIGLALGGLALVLVIATGITIYLRGPRRTRPAVPRDTHANTA